MAKTSIFLLVKNIKFILAAPFQKNYLDEKDWWHYQHCIFCCVCKSIFFSRFVFSPFFLILFTLSNSRGFVFLRRILDRRRIFSIPPLAQLSLLLFSCVSVGFFLLFSFSSAILYGKVVLYVRLTSLGLLLYCFYLSLSKGKKILRGENHSKRTLFCPDRYLRYFLLYFVLEAFSAEKSKIDGERVLVTQKGSEPMLFFAWI